MKIQAVIGAAFGDEGKGLIVDYLTARTGSPEQTLVVRYNGGAQAGHTVTIPRTHAEPDRHVFHLFGSGTLRGASTHLAQPVILDPEAWCREFSELKFDAHFDPNRMVLGTRPSTRFYIDRLCRMSTPFDVAINQETERWRGSKRHGSCGFGIHETVKRHEATTTEPLLATPAFLMLDPDMLALRLRRIRGHWLPRRLAEIGIGSPSAEFHREIAGAEDRFLAAVQFMRPRVRLRASVPIEEFSHCIFEGAQGLLLDAEHKFFPHVTCSRPGLPNIFDELWKTKAIRPVQVFYTLRGYLTRHGPGPFPTEQPGPDYPFLRSFADRTNIPNEWQGHLRIGEMDFPLVFAGIEADLNTQDRFCQPEAGLAITHLDEMHDAPELFAKVAATALKRPVRLLSFGPSAADVVPWS